MYKYLILVCVFLAYTEARPKWQFLPEMPGYVPVYIQNGDTPLEEINPDLAEAFHALPAGRSVGKEVDAAPEAAEKDHEKHEHEEPQPSETYIDRRPYEKQILEKQKNVNYEVKAEERR